MNDNGNANKSPKTLKKLRSSVFSRGMSLAKVTLHTGISVAQHGITNIFNDENLKNKNWQALLKSQAALLTNELGELKGSLMKAGQMLSMYGEHFLPPEANQFLKALQSDSPPLAWEAIEPLLKVRLGERLSLLEIETTPIASASMGQVHRARILSTGEFIALKVQYPDVDKAIDSDLKTLKTLLTSLKLLPQNFDLSPLLEEIKMMLLQEVDYLTEAKLTDEFYELLKVDSRFVVPKVFHEFSGPQILATSFEEGFRVDSAEIQNLSSEKRNEIALSFLDLYFKEVFQWGFVQTDPHAGNYRIRLNQDNSQLILFDFGASRRYPKSFLIPYRQMIKASLEDNTESFRKAAIEIGFLQTSDSPELEKLFIDFCFESIEPFLSPYDPRNIDGRVQSDGTYDWKNTDLPERLSKKVFEIIRKFSWRTPPKEIVFLDRKTGGVFIFLSLLRAKINGRALLLKYLENEES
ncbi:ABC-type transporter [Bdellovibrio bacteriovorus W]|nr:ABC-type transporter [Bdellovibrio bacteriovorus W]